ncbi:MULTISPECIES: chitooligosaccharide synthase NodC [unclassified Bradyrhizobium]|uniref:chitooligosaccharide synthase NodC n=1 Tax=unclassified Bradyrhizobium TaxID=2631580 RepID=UPI00247A5ABC|nr:MULTISPECIES: chitooligosaccharide synthase NodC [unclassified Bradyrhizobium]WGS19081.1 chitooligosaccharide synthase NodC [Bradyrhizobium sp. ISRA463]WGS25917.1 chitooligosaccharide synthase NodC [Bradyrhizobium sp. ISRA464]
MDLLAATSTVAVSSYALLSTVYKSVQALYATPTEAPSPPPGLRQTAAGLPSVDVIVPCFNEDPQILSACLQSIANQDYAGKLQVFVVDDGSANRDAVGAVQRIYADDPRFSFILLRQNAGKRKAQIAAIRRSSGDLVLNVDSDTVIDADVITKLASKMSDPEIGASMGQLTASNRNDTWLTRLIDMEYWLACNEERAAQARFGAVMCCCGPCAMYRRSALVLLLDQYEAQFFRGKPSDFGEDRHLTILMLKAGFRTEYVPDAIAATVVPDRLAPYLRQQLRWARSTFRDTWLAMRLLPGLDSYLTLDVIGQNLGPLLLAVSFLTALAQIAVTGTMPWWTVLTIASMTMIRCSVAAFRARDIRFLGFSLHTPINILLLLPVKAYALCTLSNSDWLSRKVTSLPAGSEERLAVHQANTRRKAAAGAGTDDAVRRADLSRRPSGLVTSDNVCSGE